MTLDWLDEGAIQLMMPNRLLGLWRGVSSSDYDRACAASDNWLNQLPVGSDLALVLGGDPSSLVVVPSGGESVSIVRWIYGDDESELVHCALSCDAVKRTEPEIVFYNVDREW